MANLYSKNFNDADEVKNPPKAKVQKDKSLDPKCQFHLKYLGCT